MTRFDATDSDDRRTLLEDAIAAHRERGSPFCTFEAAPIDTETPPPWIQFGDGLLNLDCTDAELDRLKRTLESFPELTIAELTRPEEAEGTNVNIEAYTDDERVAAAIDAIFQEAYERDADYRLWVSEL